MADASNGSGLREHVLVFTQFLRNPRTVGAVVPSSQVLARAVVRHLPSDQPIRLVELGPGTGALTGALADHIAPIVGRIAKILLPLAIVVLLAAAWRGIWDAIGDGTILAIVLFVVIGMVVGHLLGRPERGNSVGLALATSCRHPAIALTIASANFPNQHFAGTILLYVLVSALIGVPYVMYMHRCEVPAPTPKT